MSEEQGSQSQSPGAQSTNLAKIYRASERWEAIHACSKVSNDNQAVSINWYKKS